MIETKVLTPEEEVIKLKKDMELFKEEILRSGKVASRLARELMLERRLYRPEFLIEKPEQLPVC